MTIYLFTGAKIAAHPYFLYTIQKHLESLLAHFQDQSAGESPGYFHK